MAQAATSADGTRPTSLERIGRPIGGKDLLIAAHTITLGCAIFTERAFSQA
jgi:predicted nucleic acid-binding protein